MDLYANRRAISELSKLYAEVQHEGYKPIEREKESAMYRRAGNLARTALSSRGKKKEEAQTKSANIVRAIGRQKEKERFDRIGQSPAHNEEFVGESEDREMRKLAAQERADERKREAGRAGRKSITPGKKAVGAGRDYADYQSKSIAAHDKATKGKHTIGNPFPEEVQYAEALDPVGKEDADIDNDGDTDKSDKYLHKRRKAIGKAIAKKTGMKESFSDWRQDLSEILDTEDDKQIKEKKVKNKVVIDPDLKLESVAEELGAELVEVQEIDEESYMDYAKRKSAEKKDTRMTVTAADKKGNTPAYQKYKAGDKRYKAASHMEETEQVDELYQGKHGQTEKQYQDSRSNAGKMVSGDSKRSGAAYSYRGVKNTGPNPAGGSQKPQGQGRMTSGQRTELQYRKANLMKKEEVEQIDEKAPPGAKFERMVKHIKKGYSKDGLTDKEKSIAYATAWKSYGKKKVSEEFQLDERRKEDKVAGTPRKPRNKAFEIVAKSMGTGRLGVQPRGKKKEPGKKPPAAGEYGSEGRSPAQKVAKLRADAKRAKDNMSSRFD